MKASAARLVLSVVVVCVGCVHDTGIRTEIFAEGDSTLVVSYGAPLVINKEATVLWQSERIERPRAVIRSTDRLLVHDRTEVHVLDLTGQHLFSIGRMGSGPGEFKAITGVAALHDSIAIYDAVNGRVSMYDRSGRLLADRPAFLPPWSAPAPAASLNAANGALLFHTIRTSRVEGTPMPQVALHEMWAEKTAGSSTPVHKSWPAGEGERVTDLGGVWAARRVFAPRLLVSIASTGLVAHGYGSEYCFTVETIYSQRVLRICRSWEPVPVQASLRKLDEDLLDPPALAVARAQEVDSHLPAFDRLAIAESGHVWVRTMGEEVASQHPTILRSAPERGPSRRFWDVFAPEGDLLRTYGFPAMFTPYVFTNEEVIGLLELPTGELVIGHVDLRSL